MLTITDKLLHPKFTNTTPHIKPSLKNSIYDVKSEQPKGFELTKIKYLDKDYKDTSKAKEFKKAKVDNLEDTGVKNISGVSFEEDPFKSVFGFKTTEKIPDKFLDGYYKYNLKGMTNEKFATDRLLAGEGAMTDLEVRLQNEAEFLDLYERQQAYRDSILGSEGDTIERDYLREKDKIEKTDRRSGITAETTRGKLKEKKIEIKQAIRGRNDDMIKQMDHELNDEANQIKTPKYKEKHYGDLGQLDKLTHEIKTGKDLKNVRFKAINNIYKKYDLPILTTAMNTQRKNEIIMDNYDQLDKFLAEKTDKIKHKFRSNKIKAVVDNKRLSENVATAIAKQKAERAEKKESILMNQASSKIGAKARQKLITKAKAPTTAPIIASTPAPAPAPPTPMTADDEDVFTIRTALGHPRKEATPPRKEATPPRRVASPPPPPKTTTTAGGAGGATAGGGARPTGIPLKGILKTGGAGGGGVAPPPPAKITAQDLPLAPVSETDYQTAINKFKEVIGNKPISDSFSVDEINALKKFNARFFPTGQITGHLTVKTAKQKLKQLEQELQAKRLPSASKIGGIPLQRTPGKNTPAKSTHPLVLG